MSDLTHYIELKAIPQSDITQNQVISHLMQQLHRILPQFAGRIGAGFPGYGQMRGMGGIIRLFGNQTDCNALFAQLHTIGIAEYALIDPIKMVPERINAHIRYARLHPKDGSAIRRAQKRLQAQGKWNEDVYKNILNKWSPAQKLPHIHMNSRSTGQRFILWIKGQTLPHQQTGLFSAYGLSQQATIPNF
ncbi:MAG: type I-F CRISPR-associated endoribonuclease Cas6/Csy4 [Neisseria sp.]|nr:type I-F CRISPR-associated endoribonuclease Cas6/Csy4 [Neisseria sp.]